MWWGLLRVCWALHRATHALEHATRGLHEAIASHVGCAGTLSEQVKQPWEDFGNDDESESDLEEQIRRPTKPKAAVRFTKNKPPLSTGLTHPPNSSCTYSSFPQRQQEAAFVCRRVVRL